jgi:hypothetical protein
MVECTTVSREVSWERKPVIRDDNDDDNDDDIIIIIIIIIIKWNHVRIAYKTSH